MQREDATMNLFQSSLLMAEVFSSDVILKQLKSVVTYAFFVQSLYNLVAQSSCKQSWYWMVFNDTLATFVSFQFSFEGVLFI